MAFCLVVKDTDTVRGLSNTVFSFLYKMELQPCKFVLDACRLNLEHFKISLKLDLFPALILDLCNDES